MSNLLALRGTLKANRSTMTFQKTGSVERHLTPLRLEVGSERTTSWNSQRVKMAMFRVVKMTMIGQVNIPEVGERLRRQMRRASTQRGVRLIKVGSIERGVGLKMKARIHLEIL